MLGFGFMALQTSSAVAQVDCADPTKLSMPECSVGTPPPGSGPGHHPPGTPGSGHGGAVDISHCADMPPTTRPACEAQAHSGPPLNADGTPMAPPADCGGVPCPTGHDGGPDGHHPPADCGGVPCPTGHDGGPDGPPIDPRSGQPFTKADEDKYQVYADECETSGGTISAASLAILMADGFTEPMVNGLCQKSANDGPPPAP